MASPENKPEIHASYLEPTDMPAKVEDDTNTVYVNRSESNVLFVRALHGEQSIVSIAITPDNDVQVAFPDGTTIFHPAKKPPDPSPLPLQPETPQLEQKPAKEKEPTLTVTGSFEKETMFRQVNITNKQTHQKEKQWLHKFLLRVPGETPDAIRLQTVTSLGKAAERHKKLGLQPGEEIEVRGYMQHRTDTKTSKETQELFAFTVHRKKPLEEQPNA